MGLRLVCTSKKLLLLQRRANGRHIALIERLEARWGRDQQHCAAITKNMSHLRPFQQWIDRYMDQPRPCRCERHETGQLTLCRPSRNPSAFFRHCGR